MQPNPGLPRKASGGPLHCVHQPIHIFYVGDSGKVDVTLSAVQLGLQPGQGSSDEVVLERSRPGKRTQPCGWRTLLLKHCICNVCKLERHVTVFY